MTILGKKKVFLVGIIIIISLFSIIFFFISFILIFILSKSQITNTKNDIPSNRYKYSEINPFSNTTKSGFLKLPRELNQGEYISYNDEDSGSLFFIFNDEDGGKEYTCTGSCYCSKPENNNKRKSPSLTLTFNQGLVILLTAFTVSTALQMAKDAFKNECIQRFSIECDKKELEELFWVVKDCETKEDAEKERKWWNSNKDKEYFCSGHCVKSPIFDPFRNMKYSLDEDYDWDKFLESVDCERYEMSATIEFEDYIMWSHDFPDYSWEQKAEYEFRMMYLYPLCEKASFYYYPGDLERIHLLTSTEKFMELDKDELIPVEYLSVCDEGGPPNFKNIKCVLKHGEKEFNLKHFKTS